MASQSKRSILHEVIFEAETPRGKLFDVVLLILIVVSVVAVSIETIPSISPATKQFLWVLEWLLTIFFTVEYALRLYAVKSPMKYATSFFGIIDFLAILPAYLSLFVAGTHSLVVIRSLRLLRVFRIFHMGSFLNQSNVIISSLRASFTKITVFLYFVLLVVCIFGSIMFLIEGENNPQFDSIPRSIYWSIVTITTVGFGDITPQTAFGQFLSAILMIVGYAVIAVPTGIVSSELVKHSSSEEEFTTHSCPNCATEGHDPKAKYCKHCGSGLHDD